MPTSSPRILHVIASLHTYGAQRLVASLAYALRRRFDVAVMTVYTSDAAVDEGRGAIVFDIARRSGRRDWRFFGRMVETMRAWRPSIVHTHMHNGKYWGRLAAVAAGVPVIIHTEHNSDFRASAVERGLNRVLHARTARIITFSADHAARLARGEGIAAAKLAVIPNGIERTVPSRSRAETRAAIGADARRRLVLHVGRFEGVKNQALAVDALAASAALREAVELIFVGEGPDEPAVRARAEELGLARQVRFLGFRDDVRDLLEAADLLVMTSRNEAMPLAAIEAMTAGVPIASVPWHGSLPFFCDGALAAIASSYTAPDLARALEQLLEDSSRTALIAAAARAHADAEYSLDVCAERHTALYRSLLA